MIQCITRLVREAYNKTQDAMIDFEFAIFQVPGQKITLDTSKVYKIANNQKNDNTEEPIEDDNVRKQVK